DSNGDVPGNFFMKVLTDFGDSKNQTFLTLVNQSAGARVYRWVDNGTAINSWSDVTGTVALRAGGTADNFGSLNMIGADPKHAGRYGAVSTCRAFHKPAGSTTWAQSAAAPQCGLSSIAFDPVNANVFWVSSASGSDGG